MCGGVFCIVFFVQENRRQKAPYEEHIQTVAERQGHGRRGGVHRRLAAAPGSRPGGPSAAQEGRVALLALRAQVPQIRRRGRRTAMAPPGLRLPWGRAHGLGSARGVRGAWRGGRPSAVDGAGRPVHRGFRDGVRVAHSHSIVAGGLDVQSSTTRLIWRHSLVMRVEMVASTS